MSRGRCLVKRLKSYNKRNQKASQGRRVLRDAFLYEMGAEGGFDKQVEEGLGLSTRPL